MSDPRGPAYWRERAVKARARADRFKDEDAKRNMRATADTYDAMADHIERRRALGWKPQDS